MKIRKKKALLKEIKKAIEELNLLELAKRKQEMLKTF